SSPPGQLWPRGSASRDERYQPKLSRPFQTQVRLNAAEIVDLNPSSVSQTDEARIELRRPLTRLITKTTKATTGNKWIRPPATWRLKPRSQRIKSTRKIVHSIFVLLAHF